MLEKISKNRYRRIGDYKVDRWIFQAVIYISFAFLFFIAWHYDFNLDYFYCSDHPGRSIQGSKLMLKDFENNPQIGLCKNPFYRDSWKNEEFLPPGEYGTKPSRLFRSAAYIVVALAALAFILNHLINNKGWKPNEDIFD